MLKPIDTSRWTREDILKEANLQSGAIARLDTCRRLAYSLVAIGFVLGLWGANAGLTWVMVVGVVCLVVGLPASAVLTVGVRRGRENVRCMLAAVGIDADELVHRKK